MDSKPRELARRLVHEPNDPAHLERLLAWYRRTDRSLYAEGEEDGVLGDIARAWLRSPSSPHLARLILPCVGLRLPEAEDPKEPTSQAPPSWWSEASRLDRRDGQWVDGETGLPLHLRRTADDASLVLVPGLGADPFYIDARPVPFGSFARARIALHGAIDLTHAAEDERPAYCLQPAPLARFLEWARAHLPSRLEWWRAVLGLEDPQLGPGGWPETRSSAGRVLARLRSTADDMGILPRSALGLEEIVLPSPTEAGLEVVHEHHNDPATREQILERARSPYAFRARTAQMRELLLPEHRLSPRYRRVRCVHRILSLVRTHFGLASPPCSVALPRVNFLHPIEVRNRKLEPIGPPKPTGLLSRLARLFPGTPRPRPPRPPRWTSPEQLDLPAIPERSPEELALREAALADLARQVRTLDPESGDGLGEVLSSWRPSRTRTIAGRNLYPVLPGGEPIPDHHTLGSQRLLDQIEEELLQEAPDRARLTLLLLSQLEVTMTFLRTRDIRNVLAAVDLLQRQFPDRLAVRIRLTRLTAALSLAQGLRDHARRLLADAPELAETAGLGPLERSLTHLARFRTTRDEDPEDLDRAQHLLDQAGLQREYGGEISYLRGLHALAHGDPEAAEPLAREALRRDSSDRESSLLLCLQDLYLLAHIRNRMGNHPGCRNALHAAGELLSRGPFGWNIPFLQEFRSLREIARGELGPDQPEDEGLRALRLLVGRWTLSLGRDSSSHLREGSRRALDLLTFLPLEADSVPVAIAPERISLSRSPLGVALNRLLEEGILPGPAGGQGCWGGGHAAIP